MPGQPKQASDPAHFNQLFGNSSKSSFSLTQFNFFEEPLSSLSRIKGVAVALLHSPLSQPTQFPCLPPQFLFEEDLPSSYCPSLNFGTSLSTFFSTIFLSINIKLAISWNYIFSTMYALVSSQSIIYAILLPSCWIIEQKILASGTILCSSLTHPGLGDNTSIQACRKTFFNTYGSSNATGRKVLQPRVVLWVAWCFGTVKPFFDQLTLNAKNLEWGT